MSTAQDHKRIAAELTDVFGPGAGESGTRGRSGSPNFQTVNVVGQIFNANNLKNSIKDMARTAKTATTVAEFDAAIAKAGKVSKTNQRIRTLDKVATGIGYAAATEKILAGELGTGGSTALTGLKTAVPGVGIASWMGGLFGKNDPINPLLNKGAGLVNKVPGMEYVNRGLQNLGTGIRKIPGTGTASRIAGGISEFPDEILSVPAKVWRSFRDADKNEASGRDAALTQLFTQEIDGRLNISRPTTGLNEEVVGVDLPGNVNTGVGSYDSRYNFPADEGKTTQQLFEEFQDSETYKGLISEKRGLQTLATLAKEDAATAKTREVAISELTDPVVNIQSIEDYTDFGIGTHYSDESGVWDAQTGEKLDVPDVYGPANEHPILEPIQFEAPATPLADPYHGPRQPTVEIAPMSRSDGSFSLDGGLTWTKGENPMKRVRPEEVVSAPEKTLAEKMAEYRAGVRQTQWEEGRANSRQPQPYRPAPATFISDAQYAEDRLKLGPIDALIEKEPRRRMPEILTGAHATSY